MTPIIIFRHGSHPWVSFLNIMVMLTTYIHIWPIVNLPHTLRYHRLVKILRNCNLTTQLALSLGGHLPYAYLETMVVTSDLLQ